MKAQFIIISGATFSDPKWEEIASITGKNHRLFAEKFGGEAVMLDLDSSGLLGDRHPSWGKIYAAKSYFGMAPTLIWIDCDSMFTKTAGRRDLLPDPEKFRTQIDPEGVCPCVLVFPGKEAWVPWALSDWYRAAASEELLTCPWEQRTLRRLVKTSPWKELVGCPVNPHCYGHAGGTPETKIERLKGRIQRGEVLF